MTQTSIQTEQMKPKPKTLSPVKWVLGVAVFVAVMAASLVIANWIGGWWSRAPATTPAGVAAVSPLAVMTFLVMGGIVAVMGVVAYVIVLATHCFTFNFDRPFYPAFRRKMWFANFAVGFLFQLGFSLMMFPTVVRLLLPLLPSAILMPVGFLLPFIVAQLILIWFTPWAPLERAVIRRRMEAIGFLPQQVNDGLLMGLSDPGKNSFRKFGGIEEDLGVLWIAPDMLVYRGDQQALNLGRAAVREVERKADAGATSSYFGAVHVIVRYLDDAGVERRVRFHPEGNWTMTASARALDALAERLESWRISPDSQASSAVLAAATGGFPIAEQQWPEQSAAQPQPPPQPPPPLPTPLPPPPLHSDHA